jgi:hypothetical protein
MHVQIHIYHETYLVDVIYLGGTPTAVAFGRYSREEGALIVITKAGETADAGCLILFAVQAVCSSNYCVVWHSLKIAQWSPAHQSVRQKS